MLAIASLAVFMSAPGQSFSIAAFVDPMLADLKLQRTNYSFAYMIATLAGGVMLPFVGRTVDLYGARIVLPIVTLLLGCACGWMSQLSGAIGLYIGFSLIRCLGQGSLTLISNWIIGEWFHRRRGLAAGICALGGTASVLFFPQLNGVLIDAIGWRETWWVLGIGVAVFLVFPSMLFLRDRPEPLGLLPDWGTQDDASGDPVHVTGSDRAAGAANPVGSPSLAIEEEFTSVQAIRTSAFWKIAAVVATVSLVGTGLVFHQVDILAEHGISRRFALSLLGIQAVAATVSTLAAGYLTDRLPVRYVLACSMLFEVLALTVLIFLPTPRLVPLYSILLGLQGGIIRSAGSIVWVNYFGRKHQGAVQGLSMSVMVLAAAFGPIPLALSGDYLHSYRPALIAFLILPVASGLGVLSAKPPTLTSAA